MTTPVMIEARGLTKQFGSFLAVRDVTFEVPAGQVVAFLGPNGAGKTTTMRLLTGFIAPTRGTARIAGIDVQADRIAAAEHLGYLPENGPLYPDMTPMAMLGFFGRARGLGPRAAQTGSTRSSSSARLSSVAYKPIGKLSKGYRQRVSMAQALLHDPEVLIMDEPTSGLDPNQIKGVRQLIRELGRSKTMLVSTHILQEVEPVADRVLFIHDGRIVFDGTPAEMRRRRRSLEEQFYQPDRRAGLIRRRSERSHRTYRRRTTDSSDAADRQRSTLDDQSNLRESTTIDRVHRERSARGASAERPAPPAARRRGHLPARFLALLHQLGRLCVHRPLRRHQLVRRLLACPSSSPTTWRISTSSTAGCPTCSCCSSRPSP